MTDRREVMRARLQARREQFEVENARLTARAGRNLVIAVSTGLVFAAVFLVSLFLWAPLLFILGLALGVLAVIELASAMRQAGLRVPRIAVAFSAVVILVGTYYFGAPGLVHGLFLGSAILVLWRVIEGLFPSTKVPWRTLVLDVFAGLFTLAYVPFLLGMALLISEAENGRWWIFVLVLVVVSCDIGAYAAGVSFGKHKMAPRVSPNKTWEGLAGAATLALVAATLSSVFLLQIEWWHGVVLGLLVLLTATVGDLTESLIKRNLGIKDMSSWLPGHGGLLDRLDSILPSIVPVYAVALLSGALA